MNLNDKYLLLILEALEHHMESMRDSNDGDELFYHSERADFWYSLLKNAILPQKKDNDELPFSV